MTLCFAVSQNHTTGHFSLSELCFAGNDTQIPYFLQKLKTTRALLILPLMSSSSVLQFTPTVLPRYTNDKISSRWPSLILISLLGVQLISHSPSLADFFIIRVVLSCICWLLLERNGNAVVHNSKAPQCVSIKAVESLFEI